MGAARVLATDGDEQVCAAIQRNVEINASRQMKSFLGQEEGEEGQHQRQQIQNVKVEQLWWGTDDDFLSEQSFDLVLGADVTYDTRVLPDLISTISRLLGRKLGSMAIIAATLRNQDTLVSWERACGKPHQYES